MKQMPQTVDENGHTVDENDHTGGENMLHCDRIVPPNPDNDCRNDVQCNVRHEELHASSESDGTDVDATVRIEDLDALVEAGKDTRPGTLTQLVCCNASMDGV